MHQLQQWLLLCLPVLGSTSAPAQSPRADSDVICAAGDRSDCYPKLFQPTEHFQLIREGQDIPPNLHVRLNVYTGEREARLNIPMEGEEANPDLPMEPAVLVVNQPDQVVVEPSASERKRKALAYETEGKVKHSPQESTDYAEFHAALSSIKNTDTEDWNLDSALDNLSGLAHDVYYGEELVKDSLAFEKLTCIMAAGDHSIVSRGEGSSREQKAAGILAASLQNNPAALKELHWRPIANPTCVLRSIGKQLGLITWLRDGLLDATMRAKIAALSGFLKHEQLRDELLKQGVMEYLLEVMLEEHEGWNVVRKRIAQLLMDVFLDEDLGAELGIWPKGQVAKDAVCAETDTRTEDGCWEYHIRSWKEIWKQPWAKELLKALDSQRAGAAKTLPGKEL